MKRRVCVFLAVAAMVVSCSESDSSGGSGTTTPEDPGTLVCSKNDACAAAGQLCCGGVCTDVQSNPKHCGKCDIVCGSGVCVNGECQDNSCTGENKKMCSGECVNVSESPKHCGACGKACGDNMICENKSCACAPEFRDCNGDARDGCEFWGDTCLCEAGAVEECYPYLPATTRGVGICKAGSHTCDGVSFGECIGAVGPVKEIPGDGLDNDCDGEVDEENATTIIDTPPCSSQAYSLQANVAVPDEAALMLAQAMDICTTVENDGYGLIRAQLLHADGSALESSGNSSTCGAGFSEPRTTLISPSQQLGVITQFGGIVDPVKYETMAVLSSGKAAGKENASDKDCSGSEVNAPAEFLAAHGGHLPESCGAESGQGTKANDSVMLRLELKAPAAAKGFKFRFKFYSKEYPDFVCDKYNDFFLALTTAKNSSIPSDHNVSFDSKGNPVSVNNAFFTECDKTACTNKPGCSSCEDGTDNVKAYVTNVKKAGATSWLYTSVPVEPSETFTLDLVIFDAGEIAGWTNTTGYGHQKDSLVLLDAFEWLAEETEVFTGVN